MACGILHPLACVSSAAKSAAGSAFSSIAHDFANFAASAVNWLWTQLGQATAIRLGGPAFATDLGIVAAIAGVMALGLFTLQVIGSVLRRDPSGLGRAVRGLFIAFLGGSAAIAITSSALTAVDALCTGVVRVATGGSLTHLGHSLLSSAVIADYTSNPAALVVLSLAALAAVFMVWLALAVRKILVVLSAIFAPFAFAGGVADITVGWVRRWIEVTVALIVSKLILVLIFVVGLGMLVDGVGEAGHGGAQTATQVIAGLLVLALAGFAPWMALKVVHFAGEHFGQIGVLAAGTTGGARAAIAAPQKVTAWTSSTGALATKAGAAAGGGGSGNPGVGGAGRPQPGGQGAEQEPGSPGPTATPSGPLNSTSSNDSTVRVQETTGPPSDAPPSSPGSGGQRPPATTAPSRTRSNGPYRPASSTSPSVSRPSASTGPSEPVPPT